VDSAYQPTARSTPTRYRERAHYDRRAVHAILDEALICHLGYSSGGRQVVLPTTHVRRDETLYLHGSTGSGPLLAAKAASATGAGLPVCVTVAHIDALVQARSGFHHSVNYRAVMAWGTAHQITDKADKLRLMDNFIDRVYPGRSKLIRQPNAQELKATTLMGMAIETASGKIRNTHVGDEEEDYAAVPAWSAVIPVAQVLGTPSECPRQLPGLAMPEEMKPFRDGARLDEVMLRAYADTFGEA